MSSSSREPTLEELEELDYRRHIAELEAAGVQLPVIAQLWRELSFSETRALAVLADRPSVGNKNWFQLTAREREAVLLAVRRAVELGRLCAGAITTESKLQQKRGKR